MSDENELMLSFAREFAEAEVEPVSLEIEHDGIPSELLSKMSDRGYLGAVVPEAHGGAGLSESSYLLLLETLARYSPSLSFYTYLQNSLFLRPLLDYASESSVGKIIRAVASGKESGTLVLDCAISNASKQSVIFSVKQPAVSGSARYVVNPAATHFIVPATVGEEELLLLTGGWKEAGENARLGFRGIGFSQIEFTGQGSAVVLQPNGGPGKVGEILIRESRGAAAIALGLAEGTVARAVEYSKARTTFGSRLERYEPVAFQLSSILSELEVMREYLYSTVDSGRAAGMISKIRLIDTALRASTLSMQVHGGNGYFEAYQIEKYYRDAMALNALTGRRNAELRELSRLLIGEGSAEI